MGTEFGILHCRRLRRWPGHARCPAAVERLSGARDARDIRDAREARDVRDAREVRDVRDAREARDVRDAREVRDAGGAAAPQVAFGEQLGVVHEKHERGRPRARLRRRGRTPPDVASSGAARLQGLQGPRPARCRGRGSGCGPVYGACQAEGPSGASSGTGSGTGGSAGLPLVRPTSEGC